jgi:hypothetical protein
MAEAGRERARGGGREQLGGGGSAGSFAREMRSGWGGRRLRRSDYGGGGRVSGLTSPVSDISKLG